MLLHPLRDTKGGKGVSGLEKGWKRDELTLVGKASGVSSSVGRGSDGMAGIGNRGSVVVGSDGGSDGKRLLVEVGLSGDLDIDVGFSRDLNMHVGLGGVLFVDVRLGRDLNIHVGLSGVLLVDVGLSGDLNIDVGLGGDLLVEVGLSGDLDINIGLSGGVEVGVGNGRIVRSSIDSSVGNSRGSSD